MRIDAARHDVTAGRVQRFVTGEIGPDLDDLAALDLHIGVVGQVRGHDGAALDHFACHCRSPSGFAGGSGGLSLRTVLQFFLGHQRAGAVRSRSFRIMDIPYFFARFRRLC